MPSVVVCKYWNNINNKIKCIRKTDFNLNTLIFHYLGDYSKHWVVAATFKPAVLLQYILDLNISCVYFPGLRSAEVVQHAVGLRPHRVPVRVEGEWLDLKGGRVKVVHCYGHGGYGVTCAPGTTKHAVKIAKEMLMANSNSKL